MREEHLRPVAEIVKKHDLIVISDEIYGELTYGGERHVSIASLPGMKERTVIVSGLSKSHAMTGWRIGYAVAPVEAVRLMTKIHQFAIMSAPTTSQYAALEAIASGDNDIADMREEYDGRRKYMLEGFRKIGLSCFEPQGAFYMFPDIRSTGMSSEEFCERLLREQKVAVIPGDAFGAAGDGFVRCSYCYSIQTIGAALEGIERFIRSL